MEIIEQRFKLLENFKDKIHKYKKNPITKQKPILEKSTYSITL